jgi:hypothetical protein
MAVVCLWASDGDASMRKVADMQPSVRERDMCVRDRDLCRFGRRAP